MANFKENTRYTNGFTTTNRSNKKFLVLREALELEPTERDIYVTITQDIENRADLIADKAYGDTKLWWVIYEFNSVRDPLFDLSAGSTLRLPPLDLVLEAVNNLGQ